FNMAIAGVLAGYLPYSLWGENRRSLAVFLGGFLSVMVSACLALAELLFSGVRMPPQVLTLSLALFLASAMIEGAITLSAVGAIERLSPGTIRHSAPAASNAFRAVALASLVLAVVGIVAASAAPDGIEHLAQQLGLTEAAGQFQSPLAGYE